MRSPRWPRSRGWAACYDEKEHKEILQTLVSEQHALVEKTGQTLKLLGNPFVETPIDHYIPLRCKENKSEGTNVTVAGTPKMPSTPDEAPLKRSRPAQKGGTLQQAPLLVHTMLGGTRQREGRQTLWPRPGSRQLRLAGNQPTWRSSTKAAATKSCREQHQDRPDDPDPLPYPEYDHQGQGEETH